MARKVEVLSTWSVPRHPRAPDLTLQDILLSPRAFPIQRFTANPPVARGFVAKADLQPPYNITFITAIGWVSGYRDGLVHRELTNREIVVEAGYETLSQVAPVGMTFFSFAAGQAGANELLTDALDELAQWLSLQRAPGAAPLPAPAAADQRHTFSFAFVDLVETQLLQVTLSGLQRVNNNFKVDGGRDLALTLEDAHGQRRGYSVGVAGEKLELLEAAFTTARVRSEIAWLTKEIESEALGPSFWPTLFGQHAAALQSDSAQRASEAMAQLLEAAKQARESAGLTEARLAAQVLERMRPTLAGLRQLPAWDPHGKTDLEQLAEKASQA